jgi:hypothetical protein
MTAETEHWDTRRVEQNTFVDCDEPILFYTDGLGPCIGACIAWKSWAGILHSADIYEDEEDLVRPLIQRAKEIIPASVVPSIHPVICGGDTHDEYEISDNPKESAAYILQCRIRIVEILNVAGFGKPHVRWNGNGQTAALVADLKNSVVYVEHDHEEVRRWPILQGSTP